MKKPYITPSSTVINVRPTHPLAASGNEYGSDQGYIHFNGSVVDADDSD